MNRQGGPEADTKILHRFPAGTIAFRLVVEVSMMGRIIAADTAIDSETIEQLRVKCVQDAKKSNGQISFRDALRFCDLLP